MKEIRIHGRGGMGTVKAAEVIVHARVAMGGFGNSIPFFGFERQGAPVTAFVKLSDSPIRPKTQVYEPDCVIVLDQSIQNAVDVFEGITEHGIAVLNSPQQIEDLQVPGRVEKVALIDATSLALKRIGKAIPNTAMLGAFVKVTEWVNLDDIAARVEELWGTVNADIVRESYELTRVHTI